MSVPPMLRLWQELQEMKPDLERRGSKYSFLPSSAWARLISYAGRIGVIGSVASAAAQEVAATIAAIRGFRVMSLLLGFL